MKRLFLIFALVLFSNIGLSSLAYSADWVKAGTTINGDVFYYDKSSIVMYEEPKFTYCVLTRTDYSNKRAMEKAKEFGYTQPLTRQLEVYNFDVQRQMARSLAVIEYGPSGDVLYQNIQMPDFTPMPEGSRYLIIFDATLPVLVQQVEDGTVTVRAKL